MKKFIEILQDSAGVIEKSNESVNGFFTGEIETCMVTTYKCENGFLMIHDSGQLKISDICKLIKKYGQLKMLCN